MGRKKKQDLVVIDTTVTEKKGKSFVQFKVNSEAYQYTNVDKLESDVKNKIAPSFIMMAFTKGLLEIRGGHFSGRELWFIKPTKAGYKLVTKVNPLDFIVIDYTKGGEISICK